MSSCLELRITTGYCQMLNEKRVNEAKSNVKTYLAEGLLAKQQFQSDIYKILVYNADDSLETASFLLKNNKYRLWVIVFSYYSMFYIANATLLKIGYKVGDKISHKVTNDALIVFVKDKLKSSLLEDYEEMKEEALLIAKNRSETLIENFEFERKKRSTLQYQTGEHEKASKADTSLKRAIEFVAEMKKFINEFDKK